MSPTRFRKVPLGFTLVLCTAYLLTASLAFATAIADVGVTKTDDTGGTASAGQTVTFTVDFHNFGPSGASQVHTIDNLDSHLTSIVITSATQPADCQFNAGSPNNITCDYQGIGNAGDNLLVFTAVVDPATTAGTIIQNCASVVSTNSSDPNPANDTGCNGAGFTVVVDANLAVTKTQTVPTPTDPATAVPGGTNVTYRIVATNNGPSSATNVVVADTITVGSATFVSATPVAPNTNGLDCSGFTALTDPNNKCTVASLANGQSVSFDLVVTLPNDGTTTITDTATTSSDTNDPDTSDNTSNVTTLVCQSVDLAITKVCSALCAPGAAPITTSSIHGNTALPVCPSPITEIQGGFNFEYLITVTNNDASVNATNVTLNDVLPVGVSFVSVSPNPCSSGSIPTNDCNLGTINASTSVSFAITVTAVESGPVNNSASVSADQCDRNTQDNSSSCQVTVDTNNMPTALEVDREGCTNVSSPFCTGDADSVATVSDINRVFEPGETVRVDPAWTNTLNNVDPDVTGAATNPTSPAGGTLTIDDSTADYGAIPAGQQSDCNGVTATSPNSTGTGDCYQMTVTEDVQGVRPVQHWDTHFLETLSSGETKTWTLHIGDSFTDVPRSNVFYRFIETIYHNGITQGGGVSCTLGEFCGGENTRRDQMTAFVARSIMNGTDSSIPVSGTGYDCSNVGNPSDTNFLDTPPGSVFCRHANLLFVDHIVFGCGGSELCAGDPVSRGEMALIIARAIQFQAGHTADPNSFVPNSGTDGSSRTYDCTSGPAPFLDVPTGSVFCPAVGDLWVRHIIDGLPPDGSNYGPNLSIRRDEASKLLSNAFVNVPLYGPLPGLGL